MTVVEQARVFAAMALCGVGAGAAHDLLAVFRRGPLCCAAADLALGLLCAAGMIGIGLAMACDPFRLYAFLGVAAGWAMYSLSLGTIVRILLKGVIKLSKKVTK